jgi:hypothetical protein
MTEWKANQDHLTMVRNQLNTALDNMHQAGAVRCG